MKTIKDSVHDYIEVEDVALSLLDTRLLQRLRHVKQLGTVSLVYPSANHTRFEHSLGVYHLADEALGHLGIEGKQAERVRAAAMLHDVGHGPFSHNVEELIQRETGKYHDDVHDLIGEGDVARVLADHGLNPDAVADLVAGKGELGQLISGELDVDRMDYLARDAHHTGVPYGTIDHGRLVRELRFRDGELVLAEGNVQTAESLLVARALMTPTVYSHHVARIAKAMLRQACGRLLEKTGTTPETFRRMDDSALLVALRTTDATADFGRRLTYRDLYKRAVWTERRTVPEELLEMDQPALREREREIAEAANVDPAAVILDVSDDPTMVESSTRVIVNGSVSRLHERSTLVNALQTAQREQWRLGVYAPPAVRERVGEAAVRTLGLDIDGSRVSDAPRGIHATLDEFK